MKSNKKAQKTTTKLSAKKLIELYLKRHNNKIIIGNWKANKKFNDIKNYAREYNFLIKRDKVLKHLNFIIGIAPTLVGLLPVRGLIGKNAEAVVQHVTFHKNGAFTGQVSYEQVHEYNVNYAIVGHSETRKYLNVNDTFCRDSIRTLLQNGMRPILCVGENGEQYDARISKKVVMLELMNCLKELKEDEVKQVIIAYEPIWAIGEKAASRDWIADMVKFIRKSVSDLFDRKTANDVHVLYGGSVDVKNAQDILAINGVDGVLVGGASLKALSFYQIICSAPEYQYAHSVLFPPKNKK